MGRVFIRATSWEMGTRWGPLEGLQAHSGPSQKGGRSFFLKLQPTILGDHRRHFIIDHSHYYYYITIFIKSPSTDK